MPSLQETNAARAAITGKALVDVQLVDEDVCERTLQQMREDL